MTDPGELEEAFHLREDAVLVLVDRGLGGAKKLGHLPLSQPLALSQGLDAFADHDLVEWFHVRLPISKAIFRASNGVDSPETRDLSVISTELYGDPRVKATK